MNTKKNTLNEPLIVRLMMVAVFLPAVIALCVICHGYLKYFDPTSVHKLLFGVFPLKASIVTALVVVPLISVLLMLWKSAWRTALILSTTIILLFVPSLYFQTCPPEDRFIVISVNNALPKGTKVSCNGVPLGESPFWLTVAELRAKVPEWTTPPEQQWFVSKPSPVYTWYPWDAFTRERYDEYRFLDSGRSTLETDLKSKFWWQFETNGMLHCFKDDHGVPEYKTPFDETLNYYGLTGKGSFAPAERALLDVLVASLETLNDSEKRAWAEYVNTLPPIFTIRLNQEHAKDTQVQEMLDLVAKVRYELPDTPTPDACRRAIAKIIDENVNGRFFGYGGYSGMLNYGETYVSPQGDIAARAIRQMGDACREPLAVAFAERMDHDVDDKNFTPLLYAAGHYRFPEMFDLQVRYYAATRNGFPELLSNRDERVIPLFRTLMTNKIMTEWIKSGRQEIAGYKIDGLACVDNPMLEPYIRDYVSDQVENHLEDKQAETAMIVYVGMRLHMHPEQLADIRQWLESLHVNPALKRPAMKIIRGKEGETLIGSGEMFVLAGENVLQTQTLLDWMNENPERRFEEFFSENYPDLSEEMLKDMQRSVLMGILFSDSPQSVAVLGKIAGNVDEKQFLFKQLSQILHQMQFAVDIGRTRSSQELLSIATQRPVRLPGLYYDLSSEDDVRKSPKVNPVLVEMFDMVDDPELQLDFLRVARNREGKGLAERVEKWTRSDHPRLAALAEDALDGIQLRERIRERSKELLLQLAAGKITPDDLLPKPVPWVWEGGKYVQKTTGE